MSTAAPTTDVRIDFVSVARLFAWPDEEIAAQAARAADDLSLSDRKAARGLRDFAGRMESLDRAQREITYTATFDLAPSCSPYLGVHLFGDENRDRARLMTGLRAVAARTGEPAASELPDHIAGVLSLAPHFDDDEWRELLALVLEPALVKMERALDDSGNPYRHLVGATLRLVRARVEQAFQPAFGHASEEGEIS